MKVYRMSDGLSVEQIIQNGLDEAAFAVIAITGDVGEGVTDNKIVACLEIACFPVGLEDFISKVYEYGVDCIELINDIEFQIWNEYWLNSDDGTVNYDDYRKLVMEVDWSKMEEERSKEMKETKVWREEDKVILGSSMFVGEDDKLELIKLYCGDEPSSSEYIGELFIDEIKEFQKEPFVGGVAHVYEDEGEYFVGEVLGKEVDWSDLLLKVAGSYIDKIKFFSPWEFELIKEYKCYGRVKMDDLRDFFFKEGGHHESLF